MSSQNMGTKQINSFIAAKTGQEIPEGGWTQKAYGTLDGQMGAIADASRAMAGGIRFR